MEEHHDAGAHARERIGYRARTVMSHSIQLKLSHVVRLYFVLVNETEVEQFLGHQASNVNLDLLSRTCLFPLLICLFDEIVVVLDVSLEAAVKEARAEE